VSLKGAGTFAGLNPLSVSFGSQDQQQSADRYSYELRGATLQSIKITITGVNKSDFSGSSNCTTLDPCASCSINVVFTPQATGSRQGTLNVALTGTTKPGPGPARGHRRLKGRKPGSRSPKAGSRKPKAGCCSLR
jgi:hypothetical protein